MSISDQPSSQPSEGVIKFLLEFSPASPQSGHNIVELNAWRQILFRLGLTGRDPLRYDGLAFGNVSQRAGSRSFIVSGTQTGGKPRLDVTDYCLVQDFDLDQNRIQATGPIAPSSEALTHGAVYETGPEIGCVMHVHSPEIWCHARSLGIYLTDEAIQYGTPAMGLAVKDAVLQCKSGVIAMGGHQDGVLAFAAQPSQAATQLLHYLAKAVEFDGLL
jgi:hypothetical protein